MIPVNEPFIGKEELKNIQDCLLSGWISSKGKYINRFEEGFARFCGVKYGISVTSGTTALHLALVTLGIGPGDEVIVPDFTMIASAYAVLYTGARPIFVDSEERYWNMDVSKVEECITKKTKAIMSVHIYGHPVDMDPLIKLARKYRLFIIEDAAEAHGATYKGKKCGSMGDIGCFSFYANKLVTTGEGGMVVTDNKKLAEKARRIKDLAHSAKKRFLHTELGYNYRMTNMQAAVGLGQLGRVDEIVRKKRKMADVYGRHLKDIKGIRLPREAGWARNVYWMYSILVENDFGLKRDELISELCRFGIETRTFFVPMHRQPVLKRSVPGLGKRRFPVADYISKTGLYLPSGLTIQEDEIAFVCGKIKHIQNKHKK
jgi:perosamine synthetase